MSTFWTPSGERPIHPESSPAAPPASRTPPGPAHAHDHDRGHPDGVEYTQEELDAEMRAEMAAMQEQLLQAPAAIVIANHGIAMLELAAIHLSQEPPHLADASVAIDALGGLLDAVGPRMGENEAPLRQALHQLRMAYLDAKGPAAT